MSRVGQNAHVLGTGACNLPNAQPLRLTRATRPWIGRSAADDPWRTPSCIQDWGQREPAKRELRASPKTTNKRCAVSFSTQQQLLFRRRLRAQKVPCNLKEKRTLLSGGEHVH